MNRIMKAGTRVTIPAIEGDRRLPTYATVIGPDPDNESHYLVRTDSPVMGEHVHSLPEEDIEAIEVETLVQRVTRLTGGEWVNSGGNCMAISIPQPDGSEIWIVEREDVLWPGAWDSDDNVAGFLVMAYGPRDEHGDPAWVKEDIYLSPEPRRSEDKHAATGFGEVVDPLEPDRVAEAVRTYVKGL